MQTRELPQHLGSPLLAVFLALAASRASAAGPEVQFNRDIRPILSNKCFACHGLDAKKRKAELRLDTLDGATAQRKKGPAVVPGDLSTSQMWARITSGDKDFMMPPPESHKTISDAERATIKRWIEQGAKYQQHWSFEPIRQPGVPQVAAPLAAQVRNPIDAFLFARLQQEGLKPSPEADRPTLIRRVAFA